MSKSSLILILTLTICIILIVFTYKIFFSPLSAEDCLKLGSNFRTEECLNLVEAKNPSPTPRQVNLSSLLLSDAKMTSNTYYEPNPTFTAKVSNNSASSVRNFTIRIKFFKEKIASCDNPFFDTADDTQYVEFDNPILSGDTLTVKSIVKTNFDTTGSFNYCANIASATEL